MFMSYGNCSVLDVGEIKRKCQQKCDVFIQSSRHFFEKVSSNNIDF